MINSKCLATSEPCRTEHVNLRMAVSMGETCGVFAGSVFLCQCPVSDKVQRRDCKHTLGGQGPGANSQAHCMLAAGTWAGCSCALQHNTHGLSSGWEESAREVQVPSIQSACCTLSSQQMKDTAATLVPSSH